MNCPKCGAINEDDVRFCQNCGTPMEQQAPEETQQEAETVICTQCGYSNEPGVHFCLHCGAPMNSAEGKPAKKGGKVPVKAIIIAAACVVVAVIAVIICLSLFQTGNYIVPDDYLYALHSDDELLLTSSKKKAVSISLDDGDSYTSSCSLDGTKAAVLTEIDWDTTELYYYADGTLSLIAEDVHYYVMAPDGSAVAYMTEPEDELCDLFLYSDGKSKQIASDVLEESLCISPDGAAVGYIGDVDFDNETFRGYIWNGSSQELGKNKWPVALSSGGKYVYYVKYSSTDSSETVYVQKGLKDETKVKLCDADELSDLYFNRDGTEVLVATYDKTYLCIKGGERVKVASSTLTPMVPYNTSYFYFENGDICLNVKSFQNMYYSMDSNSNSKVIYLNKKNETSTAASNVSDFCLADDGKTLYFQKGDSIRRINASKSNAEPETLVEEEVMYFTISADGKTIFYINEDGELYGQKGTKKAKLICDSPDYTYISRNCIFQGDTVFYISDEALYSSTGEKGTRINSISEDAYYNYLFANMHAIIVYGEEDGDDLVYYSSDGKNFTLLVQP